MRPEFLDEKAAICKNCRHVYQPLKAYEAGIIKYSHIAMERLSAEERRKAIQIKNDREKAKREAQGEQKLHITGEGKISCAPAGEVKPNGSVAAKTA